MKKILIFLVIVLSLLGTTVIALAAPPAPPVMSYSTNGLDLTINWTSVPGATEYILNYAPNPYTGPETIETLNMAGNTSFSITLWDGASYFIATQASNSEGNSDYSNIKLFTISLNSEFVPGATYGDLALIDEGVSFTVFTSQEVDAEVGAITVPLTTQSADYRFANVVVDLDANGSFASYSVGNDLQEEWVVKNVPLQALATNHNFLLGLIDPDVIPGAALDVRVVLTKDALNSATEWTGYIPVGSVGRDVTVTMNELEWQNTATPDATSIGSGGEEPAPLPQAVQSIGNTTAEDISIVNGTLYRSGMPDGNQGLNQCVSQSIANNLSWLARRYNFTDKLDDAYPEDYSTEEKDHTTTEGSSTLGSLVNETYEALGSYRPDKGIIGGSAAILTGKNKFIADNNLPIESSIIEVSSESTLFAEIKKAMDDECAVELVMDILDDNGDKIGGHAVSVSGFADFQLGESNYKGLSFHDGMTENIQNNNPGNDVYPLSGDDSINNFPFIGSDNKLKLRTAKLSFAIKQCYKPVEVSCLDYYGTYNFVATSIADSSGHYSFIGNPFSGPLYFINSGGSQLVVGTPPFVNVSGTAIANGSCYFTGSGQGTVAGFPNISVTMNLTASPQGIMGTYQMGSSGGLPGGSPITYTIEAQ